MRRRESERSPKAPRLAAITIALGVAMGCASAGPWGFSRQYTPLDAEETAAAGAVKYDPVMAERRAAEWVGKPLSVFGIVREVNDSPQGTELLLSVRVLQDRNLCETASESSCRVTVSEHEFGQMVAIVNLRPEERSGEARLITGSLVRVVGPLAAKPDQKTGLHRIDASYYRHWPHKYFVTTADRDYMLR